mmetsp:Transcript_8984/g.8343  ORF Transcript_8984/g.8343 Transcript_8984/m.8343 type:complete len:166 (-) Transcript_8984:113-610(-)
MVQTPLLLFIVVLVLTPHHSLLIIEGFFDVFSVSLFIHLLGEEEPHLILSAPHLLHLPLIFHPLPHFLLHLIPLYLIVLISLSVVHAFDDSVRHLVHELLSSLLPGLDFIQPIMFLLIKHPGILFLGLDIFETLSLPFMPLLLLVLVVFLEHLLQVISLLLPLLQ